MGVFSPLTSHNYWCSMRFFGTVTFFYVRALGVIVRGFVSRQIEKFFCTDLGNFSVIPRVSFFSPCESALSLPATWDALYVSGPTHSVRVGFHCQRAGFTGTFQITHRGLCEMFWAAPGGALMRMTWMRWNQRSAESCYKSLRKPVTSLGSVRLSMTGQKWRVQLGSLILRPLLFN